MPLTGSFFNPYNQYSGKNRHNYDCEFSRLQGYYFKFIEYCTPVPLRRTYSEKSSFSRSRLHRRASVARRTYCVSQINVFDLYSSALEDFRFQNFNVQNDTFFTRTGLYSSALDEFSDQNGA